MHTKGNQVFTATEKEETKTMKRIRILTIAAFILALAMEPVYAGPGTGNVEKFQSDLENNGFIVQEGEIDFPDMATLGCQCTLPTAYAYNPSSPYGIFVLPPAPDQDPSVGNPYSEWYAEDGLYPEGWSWFVRQRPDEAIVYIGSTPPKMDYFSLLHYVYDRYHENYTFPDCVDSDGNVRTTPLSAWNRLPIFASLGDPINNMTVKVTGGSDAPFDKHVVVIIASDQGVEKKIRHTLLRSGFPNHIINTLVVSPNLIRLGVEEESDTLFYTWRLHSELTSALTSYMDSPGRIFRVSPEQAIPSSEIIPLEMPKLRVRGTGTDEMDLLPMVDALGEAIIAQYPEYDAVSIGIAPWPEGYHCIENEQSCLADNRDDAAFASAFNIFTLELLQDTKLSSDTFYVAYGINHQKTGKAVYSGVSLVDWRNKVSPVSFKNSQMPGSVDSYLDSQIDSSTADKLYAWKIARPGSCSDDDPYCQEIVNDDCTNGVDDEDQIAFIFRAYLEPATAIGPATNEVIMDRVIKFTRK